MKIQEYKSKINHFEKETNDIPAVLKIIKEDIYNLTLLANSKDNNKKDIVDSLLEYQMRLEHIIKNYEGSTIRLFK